MWLSAICDPQLDLLLGGEKNGKKWQGFIGKICNKDGRLTYYVNIVFWN